MKKIYQFEYQFKQEKRGLLNYKTFMIVDEYRDDQINEDGSIEIYVPREEAITQFMNKFPHVDMNTVEISEFRGNCIDSYEEA